MIEKFHRNEIVQRFIEGIPFLAKIENINEKNGVIDLIYLDDGNRETGVPIEEISKANQRTFEFGKSKGETLAKPLAGLVDDDSESRKNIVPTVFFHGNTCNDEVILMNGAENKQAAGGGLRALRYLKR